MNSPRSACAIPSRKQAQGGILHQSLGGGACLGGHLRKLRFLLGGEMDFHRFQSTRNHAMKQRQVLWGQEAVKK
jgi:hypothetical protein